MNLSRMISDINGNNIFGENNQHARKRSFFDERIVPLNEEYFFDNNNCINTLIEKKDKKEYFLNGQSFKNPNQTQNNVFLDKLSLIPNKNKKLIRFSSLNLGKSYCKEIATKQLVIKEEIGKVLTFQEQK